MRYITTKLICVVWLLVFAPIVNSPLQAEVIEDTQIETTGASIVDNSFSFTVFQTPDTSDPTGVSGSLEVSGTNALLDFTTLAVDEGSDWYDVNANSVFTAQTIANGDFPVLINPETFGELVVTVGESFFLGVNTGNSFLADGSGSREHFGWAEVSVDQFGTLSILDSAVAYDQGGIVVGTSQSVPEPSSATLIGLGIVGLVARRRRRSLRRCQKPNAS